MEETKDTPASLACPYCGAQYKSVVPSNVAQIKCEYCGNIFPVSPYLKDIVPRCPNHPETFATGLCNDCGGNFCTLCLHLYDLKTEGEEARLYLCPECLCKRNLKQADNFILCGVFLVFAGLFFLLIQPIVGILVFLFVSIPLIIYGFYKKSKLSEALSAHEEDEVLSARKTEISVSVDDIDALYSKMLYKYAVRWGVANAKELLDNEIYAHVRHGLSYNEAVVIVAQAKGLINAEEAAKAKAEIEKAKEKEKTPKELKKSKMVR